MSTMHNPPHPGGVLAELWFAPAGITITEAARRLHTSRKTLSEITNGRASISADMALRLSALLGTSAELWLGMQQAYDLWQASQQPRPAVQPFAPQAYSTPACA